MNDTLTNSTTETRPKCDKRIYTKLKFVMSERTNVPVSFVSTNPVTERICGVRQDSKYDKKICLVDRKLHSQVILNALYDCTLIPMPKRNGYVVIEMELTRFQATVTQTYIKNIIYLVEVKFGNKVIRFDPFNGEKHSVKDFAACKEVLEKRVDIENIDQTIEDFEKAANRTLQLLERDKYSNPRKRL